MPSDNQRNFQNLDSTVLYKVMAGLLFPTAAKIIAGRYLDDHPELLYK